MSLVVSKRAMERQAGTVVVVSPLELSCFPQKRERRGVHQELIDLRATDAKKFAGQKTGEERPSE